MKFATARPNSDPEAAVRKLIEFANSVEAAQDGRIHIELLNGPMLFEHKATPAEYSAGLQLAIERGCLVMHESGSYVRFTQAGVESFALRSNAPFTKTAVGLRKPPGRSFGESVADSSEWAVPLHPGRVQVFAGFRLRSRSEPSLPGSGKRPLTRSENASLDRSMKW